MVKVVFSLVDSVLDGFGIGLCGFGTGGSDLGGFGLGSLGKGCFGLGGLG